jgi:two-component system nitrogen regulation response regulator NtrX
LPADRPEPPNHSRVYYRPLEGESGVGKELVARQIHESSRRRLGPFVAVNCAAMVETLLEAELFGIEQRTATGAHARRGKLEHADGGTLYLDEVSDLSLSAQAKLLTAIQDLAVERVSGTGHRRLDIRVVAATTAAWRACV